MFGAEQEFDMVLDAPALNSDQLERLAANVRRRLEEIGDPAIRIPVLEDYRVECHTSRNPDDYFYYDLAVDIDIGSTVITLHRRKEPRPCYGAVDVDALARSIVMHVLLAKSDRMAITALTAAQSAVRAKIKRDGSSLAILSVRYEPEEITTPKILSGRRIWVDVGLLDNLLHPTTETVTSGSIREICGHLRRLGDKHRERLATLERITPYAGVLELDGLAEHAIAAVGRDVGEIAKAMLAAEPVEPALEVVLSRDEDIGHFGVRVRDGRIVFEAHLGHCWIDREGLLGVRQGFPDTMLVAIAGRRLGDLIDHPMLAADAQIAAVVRASEDFTEFRLLTHSRAIDLME
ncbi:hypothetical protein ACFSC3_16170 [Sphingomonas floccifaciens]|uniref:Uncharacterized protein n=3 Tax=Sphingomonas TaxID=13687 RepID=A0ABW4NHW4_9SPHN